VDRMTPPEERHRYREQIGAFLLGKLDGRERTAMQTHLNSCPVCQAEVRELEPVVAALADATPDRIDEDPWPPGDLEESTLAPILGRIHRGRRRQRRLGWSGLAAAAVCVVAIGLAGFTWLLEPAVALVEPVPFSVAPGVEVEGNLIAHDSGTEIRLIVAGLRDGQTYRVTLVSEDGERVNSGTFIGIGDKPLRCTFNAALLREEADRLEVRTPGGELVFFAKLPEEPVAVRDWPLFGILPWADPGLQNKTMGSSGSGSGTPHKGSSPESGDKGSSPGGEKPGAGPGESEPGGGLDEPPPYEPPAYQPPPPDQPPPDGQY
jgi:putative zinc finger protein